MITAFLDVFDDKLKRLKDKIKKELEKDRSKRDKRILKDLLKEAKELRTLLKDGKHKSQGCEENQCRCCPKCGHEF